MIGTTVGMLDVTISFLLFINVCTYSYPTSSILYLDCKRTTKQDLFQNRNNPSKDPSSSTSTPSFGLIHRRSNTNDNLEAETCRILIAWEDENFYFETGTRPKRRDTIEALSLSNLFTTLGDSDIELERMEEW